MNPDRRRVVREALGALGIRRFLLGVHDAAFPMLPDEDVGRGSPHSDGAVELLELASELGFDGLQLGPQGATSAGNRSPYDATLFSRNPDSIALAPLVREGLLTEEELEAAVRGAGDRDPDPSRDAGGRERPGTVRSANGCLGRSIGASACVDHDRAAAAISRALAAAYARFEALRPRELAAPLAAFRAAHAGWLVRDALYDVLSRGRGGASWRDWPAADRALLASPAAVADLAGRHARDLEAYAFVQLLAHEQHAALRARARSLGLALFADLQVGMSDRDAWAAQDLVLRDWRMGAPPSRTNPAGQAWSFPVLDPRLARAPGGGDGPVLRFVRARAAKVFAEHDGARVDHPHGLVCPWVYPAADPDVAGAGSRLHESPDRPDLAPFAIARPDQIDWTAPREGDGWVTSLDDEQVERYALLLDAIVAAAPDPRDVACEILSTQPYPLARVIARHRLGRFRVTQKANLDDPGDPYRSDRASPADWIMLGNHDTRPILAVAEHWVASGAGPRSAAYLASRLRLDAAEARALEADPAALARAAFADLFVGAAGHVHVYFTDLLGSRERYNAPGTVGDANWSLRIPAGVRRAYDARRAAGLALDVPRALARALRARGRRADLAAALDALHGRPPAP